MSHVDEGRLHAWLDYGRSGMTEAEYIAVGAHLARCAECASLLAEERALRERAAMILGGTGPRAAEPPSFEALAERARASGQLPVATSGQTATTQDEVERDWSGRRNRRPLVGLAWAASLVAALGLGWAASTLMDREQVAMQKESSFEDRATGAPAAASLSREGATADAVADKVTPEMAAPLSPGAPIVDPGRAGDAAVAAPPPSAAGRGENPSSRVAPPSQSANVEELVVTGFGTQSRATVSGSVAAAEQQEASPVRTAAGAAVAGNDQVDRGGRNAVRDGQGGNVIISGVVRNTDGSPIMGAAISLQGTTFTTISRQNGAYELTVPANAVPNGATLVVETLGFASQEASLSAQGSIAFQDFRLAPAALNLQELVAIGYGQQTRQTVSGRVSSTIPDPPADRPSVSPTRSQPAASPAAPPAAPPVAPDLVAITSAGALGFSNQPSVIWRVVTAEQAGQRLGRGILIHPGFPLLRIEMPSDGQLPLVRVLHALPGGGILTITQSRMVEGQRSLPTTPDSASLILGDLVVTGTGPISPDSIGTLLEGLR